MAVEETVIPILEDTQEEVEDMIGHFLLALVTDKTTYIICFL